MNNTQIHFLVASQLREDDTVYEFPNGVRCFFKVRVVTHYDDDTVRVLLIDPAGQTSVRYYAWDAAVDTIRDIKA